MTVSRLHFAAAFAILWVSGDNAGRGFAALKYTVKELEDPFGEGFPIRFLDWA